AEDELGAAGGEAGEVFGPVVGFGGDDVESGMRERFAVGEGGVRDERAEDGAAEGDGGEQGVAFRQEDRAAGGEVGLDKGAEGGGGGGRERGGGEQRDGGGAGSGRRGGGARG